MCERYVQWQGRQVGVNNRILGEDLTLDWCWMLLLDGMWLPVYVETGGNVQRHECLQHNYGRVQAARTPLWGTVNNTLTQYFHKSPCCPSIFFLHLLRACASSWHRPPLFISPFTPSDQCLRCLFCLILSVSVIMIQFDLFTCTQKLTA